MLFLFISKLKPSTSVPYKLSKRHETSSSEEGLNPVSCVSSPSALKESCTHPHQPAVGETTEAGVKNVNFQFCFVCGRQKPSRILQFSKRSPRRLGWG